MLCTHIDIRHQQWEASYPLKEERIEKDRTFVQETNLDLDTLLLQAVTVARQQIQERGGDTL